MHGKNYRQIKGMAYTSKKFAPGAPNSKVARFTTGKARPDYDFQLRLVSEGRVQIRHNALEAARVAANKKMALIGEDNYFLVVKTYPHIILRENKMIATAGADRLQEGMRKAFGKPIGLAARVEIGSKVLELDVKSENLQRGRDAMWAASTKLPMKTHTEVVELEKTVAQ
ncbi:MAG TPA: 50S ribosomal protein L16 [Nitrososphaerales archaeon]|nr:50S ribosomal protein L16 [Nitrososphaerales archaeon]